MPLSRTLPAVLLTAAVAVPARSHVGYGPMLRPESVEGRNSGCPFPRPAAAPALPNDNRSPAGTLTDGVLDLRLVVRMAGWYPEGATSCALPAHAFSEAGKPPSTPGPLIRVRVGRDVRASVRNELATAIRLAGLQDHGGGPPDTTVIAAGETREFRFRVTVPGTYFYRALSDPPPAPGSPDPNSQLVGAFIVDPPGAIAEDRVLVITRWRKFVPNPAARSGELGFPAGQRALAAVNGLSWPHTERHTATVGDTVRWRVINADVGVVHPLHLHGFYFRVDAHGDMARDTVYDAAQRRMAVTQPLAPWRTMAIEWSPDRPGNWLFHCHMVAHMSPRQRLDRILAEGSAGEPAPQTAHTGHAHEMAGLIVGITVRPTGGGSASARPSPEPAGRRLRLFAQQRENVFAGAPGYGFVLQQGPGEPARDSIRIPGAELALTRGEPVEITVINRASSPLSVHWHGIELESFFDGVAGWSGDARRLAPPIAPNDSFVVRFTPPRAGTFIYHVHDEGGSELASGLYGPLVVREPGADAARDRLFVLADAGPGRGAFTFVNGTTSPDTLELIAGQTYRFRFVGISANGARVVTLAGPSGPHAWRPVARDGWELERAAARPDGPALLGAGMTADYEVTSAAAGVLTLTAVVPGGPGRVVTPTVVPIRVRAP